MSWQWLPKQITKMKPVLMLFINLDFFFYPKKTPVYLSKNDLSLCNSGVMCYFKLGGISFHNLIYHETLFRQNVTNSNKRLSYCRPEGILSHYWNININVPWRNACVCACFDSVYWSFVISLKTLTKRKCT